MKHVALLFAVILGLTSPSFANDKTAECVAALAQAEKINKDQPIEVDSVTNTTAARASCEAKTLVVTREIDLKHARMEADFKDFLTKQISDHACADKTEGPLIRSGWTVRYENVFNDGPVAKIVVACK